MFRQFENLNRRFALLESSWICAGVIYTETSGHLILAELAQS